MDPSPNHPVSKEDFLKLLHTRHESIDESQTFVAYLREVIEVMYDVTAETLARLTAQASQSKVDPQWSNTPHVSTSTPPMGKL